MKTRGNALGLGPALVFIGSARVPGSFRATIPFVGSVAAIVVPVAEPHFLDASAVHALKFVRFAGLRWTAIVLVGTVATVPIPIAKVFGFYALPIATSFFIRQALAGGAAALFQGTVWKFWLRFEQKLKKLKRKSFSWASGPYCPGDMALQLARLFFKYIMLTP